MEIELDPYVSWIESYNVFRAMCNNMNSAKEVYRTSLTPFGNKNSPLSGDEYRGAMLVCQG